MNELYWITRLDGIDTFLQFIIVITAAVGLFGMLAYPILRGEVCHTDEDVKHINEKYIKGMKICIPTLLITILLRIFIPTTNEALAIYGIGGTIDFIQQNETAKQLPDKVINALDAYLDKFNKKEE